MGALAELIARLQQYGPCEASRLTGVPKSTISRICSDDRVPSIAMAERLAAGLGLRLVLVDCDNKDQVV